MTKIGMYPWRKSHTLVKARLATIGCPGYYLFPTVSWRTCSCVLPHVQWKMLLFLFFNFFLKQITHISICAYYLLSSHRTPLGVISSSLQLCQHFQFKGKKKLVLYERYNTKRIEERKLFLFFPQLPYNCCKMLKLLTSSGITVSPRGPSWE